MSASQAISPGTATASRTAWAEQRTVSALTALPIGYSAMTLLDDDHTEPRLAGGRFGKSEHDLLTVGADARAVPKRMEVLQQLARILRSKAFIQSDKLSRFLGFVVEHVLDGNAECLKEYLIGVEVYGRKPPYDPSQDSIVRTEARRLRGKLKEYYETQGDDDPLYVFMRPGSYAPIFQCREDLIEATRSSKDGAILPVRSSAVVALVLPFTDISENPISATYARALPDELAYVLATTYGCSVLSPAKLAYLHPQEQNLSEVMLKAGAHIAFEGSVRMEGSHLRITANIMDAKGVQLWVKRIDADGGTELSFAIEERIASELSAGLDAVLASSSLLHSVRARSNSSC